MNPRKTKEKQATLQSKGEQLLGVVSGTSPGLEGSPVFSLEVQTVSSTGNGNVVVIGVVPGLLVEAEVAVGKSIKEKGTRSTTSVEAVSG